MQNNASAVSFKIPRKGNRGVICFQPETDFTDAFLSFCFLMLAFWGLTVMMVTSHSFCEWLQKQYGLLAVTYPNMVCELILSVQGLIPVLSIGLPRQGPKMIEAIIIDGYTGASDK